MNDQLCHIVFYDGNCGLCDRVVRFVLKEDKKHHFVFAPLQGETASRYLRSLPPELRFTDSLILIENFRTAPRVSILAKAALRIAWLLGWPWMTIGMLSIFPGWMFDWIYRLIAAKRHHFFPKDQCFVPPKNKNERFLP